MTPRLAEASSNRAHGTPTSNNSMISAQLLIIEAGISTAEACQTKITLELADLKIEMATLRRMLGANSSSSTAPSSSPAVKHHSISAISSSSPAPPSVATISTSPPEAPLSIDPRKYLCRLCNTPIHENSEIFDKHLRAKCHAEKLATNANRKRNSLKRRTRKLLLGRQMPKASMLRNVQPNPPRRYLHLLQTMTPTHSQHCQAIARPSHLIVTVTFCASLPFLANVRPRLSMHGKK